MWRRWKLKCPECGYRCYYEALWEKEGELCPMCGHSAPFIDFVEYEVEL